MEKSFLALSAFAGILIGKFFTAFSQGLDVYRPKAPDTSFVALNLMAQQNQFLIQHLVTMQNKFMQEVMSPVSSDASSIGEISCSTEDIELIRSLIDDDAEKAVKETASWAHNHVDQYDLELRSVSIEPDKASDPDRTNDVVLVFHVKGSGSDALRFQADCSRKMREICSKSAARSVQCLRTDVRWS